jgi:hypothetical protein
MNAVVLALLFAQDWQYVAPKPGAEMEHSPFRALETSREKPEGLTEAATYRGKRRYYSQLRFGSPSSVRIAVVLDEGDGEAFLYVDRNRDRAIDEQDRLAAPGPLWRFKLDAHEQEGDAATIHKREVVVRKGRQPGRMSLAAVGYLEGKVELDGQSLVCRRTDEDGNGRFGDPDDRFHLDLDRNGSFDALTERFAVMPITNLVGRRYAVGGDPWKGRLNFTAIEGEGKLALRSPTLKERGKLVSVRAGLAGRDGTPAALAKGDAVAAPPGEFRMDTLNLVLAGAADEPMWQYTFSYRGGKPHVWRALRRDETLTLDPVGALAFSLEVSESSSTVRPGADVSAQLRLFTADGLLINEVLRATETGPYGSQPSARVTLQTTDGRILGEAHSGFA